MITKRIEEAKNKLFGTDNINTLEIHFKMVELDLIEAWLNLLINVDFYFLGDLYDVNNSQLDAFWNNETPQVRSVSTEELIKYSFSEKENVKGLLDKYDDWLPEIEQLLNLFIVSVAENWSENISSREESELYKKFILSEKSIYDFNIDSLKKALSKN